MEKAINLAVKKIIYPLIKVLAFWRCFLLRPAGIGWTKASAVSTTKSTAAAAARIVKIMKITRKAAISLNILIVQVVRWVRSC